MYLGANIRSFFLLFPWSVLFSNTNTHPRTDTPPSLLCIHNILMAANECLLVLTVTNNRVNLSLCVETAQLLCFQTHVSLTPDKCFHQNKEVDLENSIKDIILDSVLNDLQLQMMHSEP